MQVMGVYDEALVEPLARVLANLGVKRAMVVYGTDGLDEISASAPTKVCEVKDEEFTSYTITPEQFGFEPCDKSELVGGTAEENAAITREILDVPQARNVMRLCLMPEPDFISEVPPIRSKPESSLQANLSIVVRAKQN